MKNNGVKINYLYNSGFALETEKHFLIFDYFMDSVDKGEKSLLNGAVGEKDLLKDKSVVVFSSHSHADHFNPVILGWREFNKDIEYVLSSDIEIGMESGDKKIHSLSAYEELKLGDIYVKAYGSTDIGISFLVRLEGITVFHAGDLNWWFWWDDSPEEIEKAEVGFKKEIEAMKGEMVNIAFFPVDPRLEHNYYIGAQYFVKNINPEVMIPMHFGNCYETTRKFADKMEGESVRVIEITHRGQEILL